MAGKLIGSVVLLGMAFLLAFRGGSAFRERILQLEGFILLLRHIREEIAVFRTPTQEILSGFYEPALERAGFLPAARSAGMAAALSAARDRLYLEGEELSALTEFSAGFGRGFVEEELARCDLCLLRLGEALASRREALPRVAKLYRTLLFGGAATIIIVLL